MEGENRWLALTLTTEHYPARLVSRRVGGRAVSNRPAVSSRCRGIKDEDRTEGDSVCVCVCVCGCVSAGITQQV